MGAASLLAVEDDNRQAHPEPASRARALPAFLCICTWVDLRRGLDVVGSL